MGPASLFKGLAKAKAKVDPWWFPVAATAGLGAVGYARHRPQEDGRSGPEHESLQKLQDADEAGQLGALKEHRKNVSAEERAGGVLASTGASLAGWGGKELLKRVNRASDQGHRTSPEVAEKLYRAILPEDPAEIQHMPQTWATLRGDGTSVFHFDEAGRGMAQHIPPGGNASAFGRKKEVAGLLRRGLPANLIELGMQRGTTVLPGGANPHVAAHELGHADFSKKPYAKLFRRLGEPLGVVSSLGADVMAAEADPDSTTSKMAPLVGALGTVPMLGEEAYASIKGLQGMRRAGLSPELIRHGAAQGARAWGAYAAKYGLPAVAAPYIVRKVREYRIGQREKAGLETTRDLDKQISALQDK